MAAGGVMLVSLAPDTPLPWLLSAYVVFGAGFGAINPPITRRPHPDDRRAKLVRLTRAGRAAAATAEKILDEPPAALRKLPSDDLAALVHVLEQL